MLRTHTCGELNKTHKDKTVTLAGWLDSIRIQGKIGFLVLRDRYGQTQFFLNPKLAKEFGHLKKESVIQITGKVQVRPENQVRKEQSTGEIEVAAEEIKLLSQAEELPLDLNIESTEETRLKYRYLDLRTPRMQKNIFIRHKIITCLRDFLNKQSFIEIETPLLAKSTPEGARDYLVPSRVFSGQFYALPQSPQVFKQLLMISNLDRYYQIARCLRDEDLRADRQPEFTQLDIEMSFVEREDVLDLMEKMMIDLVKKITPEKRIQTVPFPRFSYKEIMEKYGTDKPDLRHDKNDKNLLAFAWVIDFPFFEKTDQGGWTFSHNPFSRPKQEHMKWLLEKKDIGEILTTQYDLVLNGFEAGGGSIRNHEKEALHKVFEIMGLKEKEIKDNFGFMLDAFKYGTPPHGGIAFGLDRVIMILAGEESIKEVIAFPKNKDARDLMMDSPSEVRPEQLKELKLKTVK